MPVVTTIVLVDEDGVAISASLKEGNIYAIRINSKDGSYDFEHECRDLSELLVVIQDQYDMTTL